MLFDDSTLVNLCRKFNYDVSGESTLIFAVRGCLPSQFHASGYSGAGIPATLKKLTERKVDYKEAACTVGLWMTDTGETALFPGSTVPSLQYLYRHPRAENHFNILCPGKYTLVRGIHPRNDSGFQRHEALVMPGLGWIMKPAVIRSRHRTIFDFKEVEYRVDYPGDNLHASRSEPYMPAGAKGANPVMNKRFSSSGCLTILGQPREYVKGTYPICWNAWEQFMQLLNTSATGDTFSLLLFDYSDLVNESRQVNHDALKYGSCGPEVVELQLKLSEIISNIYNKAYYRGKPDGLLEGETVKAYLRFMNDYSPGNLSGEVQLAKFRSITNHFLFKHKHYGYVIN